jgi:hypothetical protein
VVLGVAPRAGVELGGRECVGVCVDGVGVGAAGLEREEVLGWTLGVVGVEVDFLCLLLVEIARDLVAATNARRSSCAEM